MTTLANTLLYSVALLLQSADETPEAIKELIEWQQGELTQIGNAVRAEAESKAEAINAERVALNERIKEAQAEIKQKPGVARAKELRRQINDDKKVVAGIKSRRDAVFKGIEARIAALVEKTKADLTRGPPLLTVPMTLKVGKIWLIRKKLQRNI